MISHSPSRSAYKAFHEGRFTDCLAELPSLDPHTSAILEMRCLLRAKDFEGAYSAIAPHRREMLRNGTSKQIAEASLFLGTLLARMGDKAAAQNALTEAKAHLIGLENEPLIVETLVQQATLDQNSGNSERALKLSEAVLIRGTRIQRAAAHSVFVTYYDVRDSKTCLAHAVRAVRELEGTASYYLLAATLKNLALVGIRAERFDIVEQSRNQLLQIPTNEGTAENKALALEFIAEGELTRGDVDQCSATLEILHETSQRPLHAIQRLKFEAMIAAIQGDGAGVSVLVDEAFDILSTITSPNGLEVELAWAVQQLHRWKPEVAPRLLAQLLNFMSKAPMNINVAGYVPAIITGVTGLMQCMDGENYEGLVNCSLAFETLRGCSKHDATFYAAQIVDDTSSEYHSDFLSSVMREFPNGYQAQVNKRLLSASSH